MQDLEEYLKERHYEFWFDIYNIEKNEIRQLREYLDYIKESIKVPSPTTSVRENIENLFLRKQLDYVEEAFSSLLLGNSNAFCSLARIMIENYVSFTLIKKYRHKKLWLDWFLWSNFREINKLKDSKNYSKALKIYESICADYELPSNHIKNHFNYGWLEHITSKCNFKSACYLLNDEKETTKAYKDFEYLSSYVHNSDFYAKNSWTDMHTLIRFIEIIYYYTDKFIYRYNYHLTTRRIYNMLSINLYESLDKVLNYHEKTPNS